MLEDRILDIVIVGGGRLGSGIANSLSQENHNITVVDINEELVNSIVDTYDVQGVIGSGTIRSVLSDANVQRADLVIGATDEDEINILTCFIARRMGARHTIARVRNPEYTSQINFMRNELGISMMLNPDLSAALEISRMIQFPSAMNIETFSNGLVDLAEIKVGTDSPIADMKIGSISSKYNNRLLICAVARGEEVYIPNGDFTVQTGDVVYITASNKYIGAIVKDLNPSKKVENIKNVMIIGASRIAFYLANLLVSQGKNVVLIDRDNEKCEAFSDKISGATVVCADANDYNVLLEEGLDDMDAVVTLTNHDEVNVMVSMFSARQNVPKNITKIKNVNLAKLVDNISTDSIINPISTSTDIITHYIRAKKHASSGEMKALYKLVDGKIEATEFIADSKTKNLGKPLSQIDFKKNILIASIGRKGKLIIPTGSESIQDGDKIIIVSKGRIIEKINDIFS